MFVPSVLADLFDLSKRVGERNESGDIDLLGALRRIDARAREQRRGIGAEGAEARTQHFPPLAESGGGHALEHRALARERCRARNEPDDRGGDLRRRHEGGRVHVEENLRLRAPTREHAQAAVAFVVGAGNDAQRNLALEHQRERIVKGRPWLHGKPAQEERGRDVIGKIGDDARGARVKMRAGIKVERVALDHFEPPGISFGKLREGSDTTWVALDRDDTRSTFREQRAGEPGGGGTHLDHRHTFKRPGRARDAGGQVEVEEEVLSERFPRLQFETADDFAQRREFRHFAATVVSAAARRSASFSAARRLAGLARPVPARSNAVPWSGEVRTNGSPSVTLTARSNAIVLIGARTWS